MFECVREGKNTGGEAVVCVCVFVLCIRIVDRLQDRGQAHQVQDVEGEKG